MPEVGDIVVPKISNTSTVALALIALLVVGVLVYMVLSHLPEAKPATQR